MTIQLFLVIAYVSIAFGTCPPGYANGNVDPMECEYTATACFRGSCNAKYRFKDAEHACVADGSHLSSIHSYAGNTQVQSLCKESELCWIGLRRNESSDGFYWTDGSPFGYNNWDDGFPGAGEEVYMNVTTGKWRTADTNELGQTGLAYVCTWANIKREFNHSGDTCPYGYTSSKSFDPLGCHPDVSGCYKISCNQLSASGAEAACVADGGHLASIKNAQENEYVWKFCADSGAKSCYIGLFYQRNYGSHWSDGSKVEYTNNLGGVGTTYNAYTAAINTADGGWSWQTTVLAYICKRDSSEQNV